MRTMLRQSMRCACAVHRITGLQSRGLAKAPKKEKGSTEEESTASAAATAGIIPINYLKDGTDPVAKPNEYYPDWLRDLSLPNATELKLKGLENLTIDEERRYLQLQNRKRIKDNNATHRL
eukprot:1017-Heterococcus_DN1.PRE.1